MIYYYGLDDQITVARKAAYVRPLSQNFRYLLCIYGPLYLMDGIALAALVQMAARARRILTYVVAPVLAVIVLAACISSYWNFDLLYVKGPAGDLPIGHVVALPGLKARLH